MCPADMTLSEIIRAKYLAYCGAMIYNKYMFGCPVSCTEFLKFQEFPK